MGDSTPTPDNVSRRHWLQAAGGASLAAMAGCAGDGDGGDGGDDGGDGTTTGEDTTTTVQPIADGWLRVPWSSSSSTLPEAELNRWGSNYAGYIARLVYSYPGNQSQTKDLEWVPLDLLEWEHDDGNNELTATYRTDIDWHRGEEILDPFTAADAKTMYQLLHYMTPPESRSENPAVVDWTVDGSDDEQLVLHLNESGYNLESVVATLRGQYITTYRNGFYGEKAQALDDATSAEGEKPHREAMATHSETLGDDPALCNPYMLQTVSEQSARFTINEDHWIAKQGARVPRRYEITILGGGSNADYQAITTGNIDLNDSSIPSSVPTSGVPESVRQVSFGSNAGSTLLMNYGHKIDPYMGVDGSKPPEERVAGPQQAKVRQAIAHAIDYQFVLENHFGSRTADLVDAFPFATPAMPTPTQQRFPDAPDWLPDYSEQDFDAAHQRLEEAGLSRDGDWWVKPNGDPLTITLQSSSQTPAMLSTINEHLRNAGIKSEHQPLGGNVWEQYLDGTMAAGRGWINPNPVEINARNQLAPGYGWPPVVKPGKYEVPAEGELDGSVSETVDVLELSADFAVESFEEHVEAARKMVWTYAYHLPSIPLMPLMANYTQNVENVDWPDPAPEGKITTPSSDHHAAYGTGFFYWGRAPPGVSVSE